MPQESCDNSLALGKGGFGGKGREGGDFGGKGGFDSGDMPRAGFSDLGANLKDIDWSQEKLEQKGQVSEEFLQAANARAGDDVAQWRTQHQIQVWGDNVPNPIFSFQETGFPQFMLDSFARQGFVAPSAIQSQGWGPAMAGRDMVGVAKTGSGKTLAFGIPGLLHIIAQPPLSRGDGPLMLVLAPTRELSQQIEAEMKKARRSEGSPYPEWELRRSLRGTFLAGPLRRFLHSRAQGQTPSGQTPWLIFVRWNSGAYVPPRARAVPCELQSRVQHVELPATQPLSRSRSRLRIIYMRKCGNYEAG